MPAPLRVLVLEDRADDAELLVHELEESGFALEWHRVEAEREYVAEVQFWLPDVVLADYALPQYDALQALHWLQAHQPDIPLIVITGQTSEEAAVACMQQGAADYLLKDRLNRLGPAVRRALEQRRLRAEQRRVEAELRASEERYRAISELTSDFVYAFRVEPNDQLHVEWMTGAFTRLTGYKWEDVQDLEGLTQLIYAEDLPSVHGMWEKLMAGQRAVGEVRIVTRAGEVRWLSLHNRPVRDAAQNRLTGIYGAAKDITERKQADKVRTAIYRVSEAAHSTQNLEDLFPAIHAIISELMPALNFYIALYDEATATLTFPYFVDQYDVATPDAPPQPIGRGLTEYVLRTGRSLLASPEVFGQLVRAGEVELIGANSIDWLGVPLKTNQKTLGVLVVQTYTESVRLRQGDKDILEFVSTQVATAIARKRAEAELRASEERFRVLAQNIPGVIYLCRNDARHSMIYLNHEIEHLTGYPKEDFLADRISCAELYHPEDAPGIYSQVDQALAAGRPFHLIYRLRQRSGEWRWVEEWGTGLYRDDKLLLLEGFVSDITERRQAEEALRQAQKTESLGVLAGGVAHDFNNLLVAMLGQASLAMVQLPPDHPARASVGKAVKAAERAADLTRQLLAYSGRGQFASRPLHLNQLILENLHLFEVAIPKHIQFQSQLAEGLPYIEADAGQMQQVVMNLILNAVEAIGEQPGVVRVSTAIRMVEEGEEIGAHYTEDPLALGCYVTLTVQDTGVGMEAVTLSKIFDPFFTTKFTGRGLGLAAVLGIVRGHKGGLRVRSEAGVGTTFELFFPMTEAVPDVPPLAPATVSESSPAVPGLVLVIDDEEPVRLAVTDILALENLPVMTAANGATGIALFREHLAEVQLVLLDLSMPGLSGEETFHELRRLRPDVRVLLSSGFSQSEAARHFAGEGWVGFLQKPYDVDDLIRAVRQHLNAV